MAAIRPGSYLNLQLPQRLPGYRKKYGLLLRSTDKISKTLTATREPHPGHLRLLPGPKSGWILKKEAHAERSKNASPASRLVEERVNPNNIKIPAQHLEDEEMMCTGNLKGLDIEETKKEALLTAKVDKRA
jgi:Zn-dependent metalloprotease